MKIRCLFATLILALVLSLPLPARGDAAHTLTVFAASSLSDSFEAIAEGFEAAHPGVEVVLNFGSSSTLAAQLLEGAAADVFASANVHQMNLVRRAGLVSGPARTFARNRLVLVVPADNPADIQDLHGLAAPGVALVLAAPGVPVRDYADDMLERMAADEEYGPDYRDAVLANLVSEEDNVRQVMAKVALGEADAGVVYASDVTPDVADQVIVLPIPDEFNGTARYPMAVLAASAEPGLAQAFVDYVISDEGQAVLVEWGFLPRR